MGLESTSSHTSNLQSSPLDTHSHASDSTLETIHLSRPKDDTIVPPFFHSSTGLEDTICVSVEIAKNGKGIPNELRKLQSTLTSLVRPGVEVVYLDYKMQVIFSESDSEKSDIVEFLNSRNSGEEGRKTKNVGVKNDIMEELDDGSHLDDDSVMTKNTLNTFMSRNTTGTKLDVGKQPVTSKTTLEHFDNPEPPPPPILKIPLSKIPDNTFAIVIALTHNKDSPLNDCGILRVITYSEGEGTSKHVSGWSPLLSQSCLPSISLYKNPMGTFVFQPLLGQRDASSSLTEAGSLVDGLSGMFEAVVRNGVWAMGHLHVEVRIFVLFYIRVHLRSNKYYLP